MEMLQHFTRSHALQDTLTISLNEGQSFLAVFLISYQILKERNIYPPWPGTKERKIWQNNKKIFFLTIRTKGTKSKNHKKKKKKKISQNVRWNHTSQITVSMYVEFYT